MPPEPLGPLTVRPAGDGDWPSVWPIWRAVVDAGDTYTWAPGTPEPDARAAWMLPPPAEVVVGEAGDRIVATAVLKPNHPGLGAHVANASFMVDPVHAGRGHGRALAVAVLGRARAAGYTAMQFNAVVATNLRAVRLWESLGFAVVGRSPGGFRLPDGSFTDLLVMHRPL